MKNNQVTISRELAELLAQASAHPGHRDVEQALEEFRQVMLDLKAKEAAEEGPEVGS